MKKSIFFLALCLVFGRLYAQEEIQDNAIIHQQQRMVFQQWDQNKFDPKKGFLDLNPYYWLVWGLFDPNYHKTDRRPLSASGPQTQRLALVALQKSIDDKYKLHSDTVKSTALAQIASQSGFVSDVDPLWILYYKDQFQPLLNYSAVAILGPLSPTVSAKLVSEGLYNWYSGELAMLKERLQGARSADMDRGSRIMAWFRLLVEYRKLAGVWNIRVAAAASDIQLTTRQQQLKNGTLDTGSWTPQTDTKIAAQVLLNAKY